MNRDMSDQDYFKNQYPMVYAEEEIKRLNQQSSHLYDPSLDPLLKQARKCLEIGCGAGSNLAVIRQHHPDLEYVGVDLNDFALSQARERFKSDPHARFLSMDCTDLQFPESSFDLIFSRLVLWSVGPKWKSALKAAFRCLAPGGAFYAFEPDDRFLAFQPEKPALQSLIRRWQEQTFQSGLNPFIGRDLYGALLDTGFPSAYCHLFSKVSVGSDLQGYRQTMQNLQRIFMGKGPSPFGLTESSSEWTQAKDEFEAISPENLTVEAYFACFAFKGTDA